MPHSQSLAVERAWPKSRATQMAGPSVRFRLRDVLEGRKRHARRDTRGVQALDRSELDEGLDDGWHATDMTDGMRVAREDHRKAVRQLAWSFATFAGGFCG